MIAIDQEIEMVAKAMAVNLEKGQKQVGWVMKPEFAIDDDLKQIPGTLLMSVDGKIDLIELARAAIAALSDR